jgi:tetratricopeptide (TPR) repeat protein
VVQIIIDSIPLLFRRLQRLAERDPRRAVPLAARALAQLPPADPISYAWARYTLGWALLCWEHFAEARLQINAAKDAFTAAGQSFGTLSCEYALMLANLIQWANPALEQDLTALASRLEQAGATSAAIRAQLYRALLLDILGRRSEVAVVLAQLAPAVARGTPLDQARWQYTRGILAIAQGDFAAAELLLAQAERAFAALQAPLDRALCWFQQGWAALRQEKLESALIAYRRAEYVFARLDLPIRLARCDRDIGLLLARMGRYDDALPVLLSALRLFTALQRTADVAVCQLNLGIISFYTGQWDIALAYFARAEALYATAGVVGKRIIVQRNQAMVYRIQGRLDAADRLLSVIASQAQTIGDQAELAEIWAEQAALLAAMGRASDAVRQYQRARDRFEQLGSQLDAAECLVELGWLALQQGESASAAAYFRLAVPLVAPHPYYRWRTDYGLARCAELRGQVRMALARYAAATTTVAGLRRRLSSEAASSGLAMQAEQLTNDALRCAADCGALADVLVFSEGQRALVLQRAIVSHMATPPADYQNQLQALQLRIAALLAEEHDGDAAHTSAIDAALTSYSELLVHARHSLPTVADMAAGVLDGVFNLAQLRAQLDAAYAADWTALVYTLSNAELLISVVTSDGLALESIAYDDTLKRQLERVSQRYLLYTYRDFAYLTGQSAQPWADVRALTDRLLPAAVRARLHPTHRLLIVPTGPLHTIPWAALRLDDCWLAERAIVQLIPSLTVWQALADRPAIHALDALLIGCSSFGTRAVALPAVAEELATVAARWPGNRVRLTDAQATRAALHAQSASGALARYGLLHIASHAQMLPTRGLAAHLKLWDGDLWLAEVAGLRLGGALVVLSTCDGALADTLPGEELLSLTWAFVAGGAGGVLASLWPVGDQRVCRFMALFYDALAQHGDAGRALADAQRSMILRHRSAPDQSTDPLTWGSFVLIGGGRLLW